MHLIGGNIEIRQDGNDGILGHSVEGLTDINSSSIDSFWVLGGVIKMAKNEVNSSDDVVDNGAAWAATKLIHTNVWGDTLPDTLNQQIFQPFFYEGSQLGHAFHTQ